MRGSRRDWDAVVVGLGDLGCGALYWLARELRGDVLGLEQYVLGHDRGSTRDNSGALGALEERRHRVRLADAAREAWRVVEEESGSALVAPVGALDLFPQDDGEHIERYTATLDAERVPYRRMGAVETVGRWPAFGLDPTVTALFREDAGLLRAADATAAHVALAREHGATVREESEVVGVRSSGGEIDVSAGGTRYRCARLVLACGAFTNGLLSGFGLELPLAVSRRQATYWQPADPASVREGSFPVWTWHDDRGFSGFPHRADAGMKVVPAAGPKEPSFRTSEPDARAIEHVRAFLERTLPSTAGELRAVETFSCASPPDGDPIVDAIRADQAEGCFVSAGAGCAVELASIIGRCVASLAQRGAAPEGVDLEPYRMDRPALREHAERLSAGLA